MPSEEQLAFADRAGRYYASSYRLSPVAGRLLGYLTVCEPAEQTIAELAEALLASRSAINGAVNQLEGLRAVRRARAAGERVDRVSLDPAVVQPPGFTQDPYLQLAELARDGLALVKDSQRRAILTETAELGDFMARRMPELLDEFRASRRP